MSSGRAPYSSLEDRIDRTIGEINGHDFTLPAAFYDEATDMVVATRLDLWRAAKTLCMREAARARAARGPDDEIDELLSSV